MANITSIEVRNDIGTTPARVNYKTGALYINFQKWREATKEQKQAFFSHEKGHVVLKTKDEQAADLFALHDYKKYGYSSKSFVKTFTKHLDINNPEHRERIAAVLKAAIKQDIASGGRKKTFIHNLNTNKMYTDNAEITGFNGDGNVVDFGKAFQNRLNKRLAKADVNKTIGEGKDTYGRLGIAVDKNASKNEKRLAKADQLRDKGESEVILANQGIEKKSGFEKVVGSLGDAVSKIVGNDDQPNQAQQAVSDLEPTDAPERFRSMAGVKTIIAGDQSETKNKENEKTKQKNTIMYVLIGVGLVVLIGVVGYFATKK